MARAPIPEANLIETEAGSRPDGPGWFVVSVADALCMGIDEEQYAFFFEGAPRTFPHFGINLTVVGPGKPAAMYHAEAGQEGFLVVAGRGTLIIEEQERELRQWDFVHCPPHTAHVIVGGPDTGCAVLMVGARTAGDAVVYPRSDAAARYGASVDEDTTDSATAYRGWRPMRRHRYPWPPVIRESDGG